MNRREKATLVTAAVAGLSMWFAVNLASGEVEAWDSRYYFTLGLPGLAVVGFALGFVTPQHAWLWAVTIGGAQVVAMVVLNPQAGPLWAVGLFTHACVTAGLLGTTYAGAFVGRLLRK